jgi:paraquat-inducible protein B
MKIVRAMKEISRLKGEIKAIKKRISGSLNTLALNDFSESLVELKATLDSKIEKLIKLKTSVVKANVIGGMFDSIVRMGELKSYIEFLRELEPKHGMKSNEYSGTKDEFKSQLTVKQVNELIETCQQDINFLTDTLDEFNRKTSIDNSIDSIVSVKTNLNEDKITEL